MNDTQFNIIVYFFFHLFHIKKVSVTDISQEFEKKQKTSTSSQTTSKCTIPLSSPSSSSFIHLSDALNPPAEECSTLLV